MSGVGSAGKIQSKKMRIWAIVLSVVVFLCVTFAAVAGIATGVADRWRPWRPDYERLTDDEIYKILRKKTLSDEDYRVLYAQTGLTKIGIDGLIEREQKWKIVQIANDYFADYKMVRERIAPFTCWEKIGRIVTLCAVEPGDILVTNSTHVASFRYGHAAIVLSEYEMAEAYGLGSRSDLSPIALFQDYASFMLLRPKVDERIKVQVAEYTKRNLINIPYRLTLGVFSKKYETGGATSTQCAHLVWDAYKRFGIDLDSNGGRIIKPQDIANSEHLEVVQIYGFHPDKLWE